MELLHPTSFASAIVSSKNSLKSISYIIAKYCGNNEAENFLDACDRLNFTMANQILDNTIKELTGYDSVFLALSSYADKFPQLAPELGNQVSEALFEADKIKAINGYREQIVSIINKNINNE